ncbi:MAG: hypothetical protein MR867_07750 [Eubacterium sp.]|nr:hypothetical protein [Eubacterium sp.]MDY5497377.1 hypothetical protein [Anaerobutyricum sp.]
MINPIMKTECLKEGRNIRLPMMVILYNALLAFITIIFMFFNAESFQEGYSYDTASYLYQFLIISTIQIGTVFFGMPFLVWSCFTQERENHIIEHFCMIPGFAKQFVIARITRIMAVNMLLFISSLPIISLSCIYSGFPWAKIVRLGIMIMIFSFWSGSISVFSFCMCKKGIWAFAQNALLEGGMLIGTLLVVELIRNLALSVSGQAVPVPLVTNLCILLVLLNPLAAYMGYYGNVTGDIGLVNTYCSHIGVDTTGQLFSLLFYKAASIICIFMGIVFLALAVWQLEKETPQEIK